MKKLVLSVAFALTAACGASNSPPPNTSLENASSIQGVKPSRSLHLRAAFDGDPSVYVGRFVKEGEDGANLDENHAAKTVCSKFYKFKEVPANMEMDELLYASNDASVSAGVLTPGGAMSGQATRSQGSILRVHYTLSKKMQIESDSDELKSCCAKNPGDCSSIVVGEFVRGSGEIYQVASNQSQATASVGIPPVAAKAGVSDASQWRKVQTFNDTYFAFLPSASGVGGGLVNADAQKQAAADAKQKEDSCDFCNNIPQDESKQGMYFCGVSPPAAQESSGRAAAMTDARTQMVKYLGEEITSKSQSLSSTAKGLISDDTFTQAVSKGLASRVEMKKSCSQDVHSPDHSVVYKVLAYVSKDALVSASTTAIDAHAGSKTKPNDAATAKDAIRKAVNHD